MKKNSSKPHQFSGVLAAGSRSAEQMVLWGFLPITHILLHLEQGFKYSKYSHRAQSLLFHYNEGSWFMPVEWDSDL